MSFVRYNVDDKEDRHEENFDEVDDIVVNIDDVDDAGKIQRMCVCFPLDHHEKNLDVVDENEVDENCNSASEY
jgi:hypothetical protein